MCQGEGKHVHPSIDRNGLTSEDIAEMGGDEFLSDYTGGMYDVSCEVCTGTGKIKTNEDHDYYDCSVNECDACYRMDREETRKERENEAKMLHGVRWYDYV